MVKKKGIYTITNMGSGKAYIGSTTNLGNRWNTHKSDLRRSAHHNSHLQRAWDKYGETAFEFGVLEYLDDPEELHLAEQFWMDLYREEGRELYNFGLVAQYPTLGYRHTEEARRRISEAKRGENNPMWGMRHSEEHRAKISNALMGRPVSEETRRRISNAGANTSEEARRRIGAASAGPYPAFVHRDTGEVIPAGVNLRAMCRGRGLSRAGMQRVKAGKRHHCHGWTVLE